MKTATAAILPEAHLLRTKQGGELLALFRRLQRDTGQIVPPRKKLNLAAAASFAPYLGILEIKEPMQAIVRLVGTAIVNRTGINNTGKDWLDLFSLEQRGLWWEHFQRILHTPCGFSGLFQENYRHIVMLEAVSLPFADEDGRPRFVVSTATELDRNDLNTRGEYALQNTGPIDQHYFDIGLSRRP